MPSSSDFVGLQAIYGDLILPFYNLERDMYVPAKIKRRENDSEHSWSLALLALMLASKIDNQLDPLKAVTYAVVHDLVEIDAGDTSVWTATEQRDSKETREAKAVKMMCRKYKNYASLTSMLAAYHTQLDTEAQFIYALDKLHNWMTIYIGKGSYYKKYNQIPKAQADEKIQLYRQKAYVHKGVGRYFDLLVKAFDEHPEYFYTGK